MCAHQKGSIKSDNVKATYDGSKWTTADVVNYSPSYQYYAYYPYTTSGLAHISSSSAKGSVMANETSAASGTQAANGARAANATRAVSANTSAADFFASGISAFTPATNQSTATNFNASDLQVGKATINRTTADDITFDFTHAMGLAEITIGSKTVPTTITYNGNTGDVVSQSGTSTLISSTDFSGNIPYKTTTDNLYVGLVRPAVNTTFGTVTNVANVWSHVFNIAANSYDSYTTTFTRPAHIMIWDFEYTGVGTERLVAPCYGTYKLEVWGAQGSAYGTGSRGGYGGYSYGNRIINANEVVYVCVGGQYGFNGGGTAGNSGMYGGGATHMSLLQYGLLANFANVKSEVILVAGGGGGANDPDMIGGYGGGGNNDGEWGHAFTFNSTSAPHGGYGGMSTAGGASYNWANYTNNVVLISGSFGQGGYAYATVQVVGDYGVLAEVAGTVVVELL